MSSKPPPTNSLSPGTINVVALDPLTPTRGPGRPRITPTRGPGRPRKVERAPTEIERTRRERVRARLHEHVAQDRVVRITAKSSDRQSTEALDAMMMEIAREAAALAFDAERAVVEGRREAERISSRRIQALVGIGELALAKARAGVAHPLDPFDPRVQKLVKLFVDSMRECAVETLGSRADLFLERFAELALGWETKTEP